MAEGWIKIHRSIMDKGWYNRPDFVALWVHLLLLANHNKKEYFWNGRTIVLNPGQFITGRKILSEKTGINQHKVDRILKVFESEQQIEQRTTSTSRLISILNWGKFQKVAQPFEQRVSSDCATGEQRLSTKEELKNEKNEKKNGGRGSGTFVPPAPSDLILFMISIGGTEEDASTMFRHYNSNGWMVGKNKMVNWQDSASNWLVRKKRFSQEKKENDGKSNNEKLRDWVAANSGRN